MIRLAKDGATVSAERFFAKQSEALTAIESAFRASAVVALVGPQCCGKSSVAAEFARRTGAVRLCLADYVALLDQTPYNRGHERIMALIDRTLNDCETLVLDDFVHLYELKTVSGFFGDMVGEIKVLRQRIVSEGKRLLLVGEDLRLLAYPDESRELFTFMGVYGANGGWVDFGTAPTPLVDLGKEPLSLGDMETIAANLLSPEISSGIDFALVRSQLDSLGLKELRWLCRLLAGLDAPDAGDVVTLAQRHIVKGNIRQSQIETLDFDRLPGSEAIAQALETHVVLPFENPAKALELGLKAKRGVMLFGPPGTGKTSIGRALAKRLGGKFFLIDGSLGTEPPHNFMAAVKTIIERARESAPAVLFIDDADLLFSIPHVAGLARLLLTLLDGMESRSASNICVMMTVMDAMKVPEALLRSGRIELWLETHYPDQAIRARMFERWASDRLPGSGEIDFAAVAAVSHRFTPADIRRVNEDAKLLYAADCVGGRDLRTATGYLLDAVHDLALVREAMADTLGDPRMKVGASAENLVN